MGMEVIYTQNYMVNVIGVNIIRCIGVKVLKADSASKMVETAAD